MVVKKKDLDNPLVKEEAEAIQELEFQIDLALHLNYRLGEQVTVQLVKPPSSRIMDRIKEMYMGAGWKVQFEKDEEIGTKLVLS